MPARRVPEAARVSIVEFVRRHPDGVRGTAILAALGIKRATLRTYLTLLRFHGVVDVYGKGNLALWHMPGQGEYVAATHKAALRTRAREYERAKARERREAKASTAVSAVKTAANSVWEWGQAA